jgi:hypothetical protein
MTASDLKQQDCQITRGSTGCGYCIKDIVRMTCTWCTRSCTGTAAECHQAIRADTAEHASNSAATSESGYVRLCGLNLHGPGCFGLGWAGLDLVGRAGMGHGFGWLGWARLGWAGLSRFRLASDKLH